VSTARVSIVIPVYNEGDGVTAVLQRIRESVTLPFEVLVVHDTPEDTTVPTVNDFSARDPRVRAILNTFGRGPANAIRFGMHVASAPVVVVTMADGCDDTTQIDDLTRLVERGVVVACASRYARGGQQVGGPFLKGFISRAAGLTLHVFARVGTRDATNSFKPIRGDFSSMSVSRAIKVLKSASSSSPKLVDGAYRWRRFPPSGSTAHSESPTSSYGHGYPAT